MGGKSTIHVPPLSAPHPLLRSLPPFTHLPADLVDLLNQTYFLHLLANDPSKVLPPGKSLLSVLSQPSVRQDRDDEPPALHEKVEEMIHKAFWDEALGTLSSTEPSTQLPRLKLLFNDLRTMLLPLFPAGHSILAVLSAPLGPTSSPLLTALNHCRETLAALRERCASARDAYIDSLSASLADPPTDPLDLAKLVVDTVRSILKFAETMKDDLSQFVLGTMGEAQLAASVANQAHIRERALVLDLWEQSVVREDIAAWLSDLSPPHALIVVPPSRKWVLRVVQALGATDPVACPLPTKPLAPENDMPPPVPNTLPPPFFFSTPQLLYIQNVLQAIVIAAALRTLLPATASPPEDFMYRIWTLLLASVNDEGLQGDTRLVNLADELVRALSLTDPEATKQLRSAVARTVRTSDPVFLLLQQRLLSALAERLSHAPVAIERKDAPEKIRTGRGERSPSVANEKRSKGELEVKGFSGPVLSVAIQEVLGMLQEVVLWIERIWADLFEPSNTVTLAGIDGGTIKIL
ncbi:hypothetical protein F5148DRAFT_1223978 [Russula earlei]|uniref:Uncharacterized protein n=1 Tax=Russula earlei TaxID=71964 RepID=A0ACC0U2C4_9AGAM|nr:hypothetical protein F5148DRAFT_1223978 [Russula earlei]